MKSDIEKIDEQIEAIQNARKKPMKKVEKEENNLPSTDTKKLNKIEDVSNEPVEVAGDTKKMEVVEETPVLEETKEETIPPVEENVPVEEKPKKKIPVIYIIFGVIIVLLIAILVGLVFFKKNQNNTQVKPVSELTEKEKEQIINNYGDSIVALVGYYKTKEDRLLAYNEVSQMVKLDYEVTCRETEIHEDTTIYLNKCRINGTSVKYSYGKMAEVEEEVLPEGTIRVYVTNSGAYLKKPKNGIKYEQYDVTIPEAYSGLKLLGAKSNYLFYKAKIEKNNGYGVYYETTNRLINFKTGKRALENVNYNYIALINIGGKYDGEYVAASNADYQYSSYGWRLYNLQTGKLALPEKYAIAGGGGEEITLVHGYLLVADTYTNEENYGLINYQTGKIIVPTIYNYCSNLGTELISCYRFDHSGSSSQPLYHIYDSNGKQKLENVFILQTASDQYAFVKDNGRIKVMDFDGKVLYDYGVLNISDSKMYAYSYKNGYMVKYVNGDKPYDYDHDMADSCIAIIYYPDTKTGEVKKTYCSKIET